MPKTPDIALSVVALALFAMTAAPQDSLRSRLDAPSEVRARVRHPKGNSAG